MLSMINPDSLQRFESQHKLSTHDGAFFDPHHPDSGKKAKNGPLNFPPATHGTKTMTNFYPGPLGSVDEHRAGLGTAQGGSRQRPTSAKIKKNGIPVSLKKIIIFRNQTLSD